jgi:hypothetical protein
MQMSHSKIVLVALSLSLSLTIGCGFDDTQGPVVHQDSGVPQQDTLSNQKMDKPLVDPVPNSACGDAVPIQGTAPAGASVFVVGGGTSGLATDAHPVTGRFCLDVPLKKNAVNNFEIRSQDPIKGMSEPVKISVSHNACKDDAPKVNPEQPASKNIALGAKGTSSDTAEEGNEGFLTDGKSATHATYSGGYGWGDFGGWVSVKFDKLYMLEKVVVKWKDGSGSGGNYGTKYSMLYSSMSEPGDPDAKNGYWTVIDVDAGDGGTDTFDLKSTKPLVRHIAVIMKQDANSWSWGESFSIAEVEAWDVPKSSSTLPGGSTTTTTTCASIGN